MTEGIIPFPQGDLVAHPDHSEEAPLHSPDEIAVTLEEATERVLTDKWNAVGGLPGEATVPGSDGLVQVGEGFYREYVNGRIYSTQDVTVFVHGAIGEKYTEVGGPTSWLGWPWSDEQPFTDDGRVATFQNGATYWWADTGAIEFSFGVSSLYRFVLLRGDGRSGSLWLECRRTVRDIRSCSPYRRWRGFSSRTQIDENVDAGDSREDNTALYRGSPYGLSVAAVLMEHDLADPNMYHELIKQGVDKAAEATAAALVVVPYVGPALAVSRGASTEGIGARRGRSVE